MGTRKVPICAIWRREVSLAEGEGFEPPVPLSTVVFKTTVIDHSTILPVLYLSRKRVQRYEIKVKSEK